MSTARHAQAHCIEHSLCDPSHGLMKLSAEQLQVPHINNSSAGPERVRVRLGRWAAARMRGGGGGRLVCASPCASRPARPCRRGAPWLAPRWRDCARRPASAAATAASARCHRCRRRRCRLQCWCRTPRGGGSRGSLPHCWAHCLPALRVHMHLMKPRLISQMLD